VIVAAFPVGDPTVLGWTTFVLYLLASVCSLRCGFTDGKLENRSEVGQVWRVQAGVLLLLGLNKQLDLQTPLIQFGKRLALSWGWYEYRSVIEIAFFAGLAVLIGLVVMRHAQAARSFARKHPLAASGDVLVGAYILIRTIYMDHLDGIMGFSLENVPGLWSGEILGLILVTSGAIQARPLTTSSTDAK
jgi:hypothetical protein